MKPIKYLVAISLLLSSVPSPARQDLRTSEKLAASLIALEEQVLARKSPKELEAFRRLKEKLDKFSAAVEIYNLTARRLGKPTAIAIDYETGIPVTWNMFDGVNADFFIQLNDQNANICRLRFPDETTGGRRVVHMPESHINSVEFVLFADCERSRHYLYKVVYPRDFWDALNPFGNNGTYEYSIFEKTNGL